MRRTVLSPASASAAAAQAARAPVAPSRDLRLELASGVQGPVAVVSLATLQQCGWQEGEIVAIARAEDADQESRAESDAADAEQKEAPAKSYAYARVALAPAAATGHLRCDAWLVEQLEAEPYTHVSATPVAPASALPITALQLREVLFDSASADASARETAHEAIVRELRESVARSPPLPATDGTLLELTIGAARRVFSLHFNARADNKQAAGAASTSADTLPSLYLLAASTLPAEISVGAAAARKRFWREESERLDHLGGYDKEVAELTVRA